MIKVRFNLNPDEKQTILVVDDTEINIDFLVDMLSNDYSIRVATDGKAALDSVKHFQPDLILLDVLMPGLSGFEVCFLLKADKNTQDIPIIFITTLDLDLDQAHGLELGAVDYITKPFNPSIVKIRIKNHLELKLHRVQLEKLVAIRTHELAESNNRLKALDAARQNYLCAISHELRTPAHGVLGIADLALWEMADKKLQAEYFSLFNLARNRLLETIDSALRLAELEDKDAKIDVIPVDLGRIISKSTESLRQAFLIRNLVFDPKQIEQVLVCGSEAIIEQIITTQLRVAQRMAIPGTVIGWMIGDNSEMVTLFIGFDCQPIPEKLLRTFFDTFSYERSSSSVEELGLTIPLAADHARSIGGKVGIRNVPSGVEIELSFLKPTQINGNTGE